jgi:hypothetical protein
MSYYSLLVVDSRGSAAEKALKDIVLKDISKCIPLGTPSDIPLWYKRSPFCQKSDRLLTIENRQNVAMGSSQINEPHLLKSQKL